jgi:hypothetical protein
MDAPLWLERRNAAAVSRAEHSVYINCPLEMVFAFTTDPANLPRWQPLVARSSASGALQTGTRIVVVRRILGRELTVRQTIADYQINRRAVFSTVDTPFFSEAMYSFEPNKDGTHVNCFMQLEMGSLFGLVTPLVTRWLNGQTTANLTRLKRVLELPFLAA